MARRNSDVEIQRLRRKVKASPDDKSAITALYAALRRAGIRPSDEDIEVNESILILSDVHGLNANQKSNAVKIRDRISDSRAVDYILDMNSDREYRPAVMADIFYGYEVSFDIIGYVLEDPNFGDGASRIDDPGEFIRDIDLLSISNTGIGLSNKEFDAILNSIGCITQWTGIAGRDSRNITFYYSIDTMIGDWVNIQDQYEHNDEHEDEEDNIMNNPRRNSDSEIQKLERLRKIDPSDDTVTEALFAAKRRAGIQITLDDISPNRSEKEEARNLLIMCRVFGLDEDACQTAMSIAQNYNLPVISIIYIGEYINHSEYPGLTRRQQEIAELVEIQSGVRRAIEYAMGANGPHSTLDPDRLSRIFVSVAEKIGIKPTEIRPTDVPGDRFLKYENINKFNILNEMDQASIRILDMMGIPTSRMSSSDIESFINSYGAIAHVVHNVFMNPDDIQFFNTKEELEDAWNNLINNNRRNPSQDDKEAYARYRIEQEKSNESVSDYLSTTYRAPMREIQELTYSFKEPWSVRDNYVKKYSYSIPCAEAIEAIRKYASAPVYDVMAGSGYWTHVLRESGIKCLAYDISPGQENYYQKKEIVLVNKSDAVDLVKGFTRPESIILSWPPYRSKVGHSILAALPVDSIVFYIGETNGGCCGSDSMFDEIHENFDELMQVDIPQFRGLHDTMLVLHKKSNNPVDQKDDE